MRWQGSTIPAVLRHRSAPPDDADPSRSSRWRNRRFQRRKEGVRDERIESAISGTGNRHPNPRPNPGRNRRGDGRREISGSHPTMRAELRRRSIRQYLYHERRRALFCKPACGLAIRHETLGNDLGRQLRGCATAGVDRPCQQRTAEDASAIQCAPSAGQRSDPVGDKMRLGSAAWRWAITMPRALRCADWERTTRRRRSVCWATMPRGRAARGRARPRSWSRIERHWHFTGPLHD